MVKKNHKIKRRFHRFSLKYLWPVFPTLILIGLGIFLAQFKVFNLKKIDCFINDNPCSLKFEPLLVNLYQQNIFKLNKKNLISQLQYFDPTLTEIQVTKKLPHHLIINMTRRLPIAQLALSDNLDFIGLNSSQSATLSGQIKDKLFKLDKTGEVFDTINQPQPDLPLVQLNINQNLQLGKTDLSCQIAALINQLNSYFVSFNLLAVFDSFFVIKTALGPYAVISSQKAFNSQVASLQYVLTNIKIDQSLPAKIDLRFDKPILSY